MAGVRGYRNSPPGQARWFGLPNVMGYAPREGVIEAANMTEYRRAFEVNFWGPVQVVQAMTPLLRESNGRVINTTSSSVYITMPMFSA